MKITETIKQALVEALGVLDISVTVDSVVLEHPAELVNGDYSTSAALAFAKQKGMAPRALAEEIVKTLGTIEGVTKIDIAGPGFINFHLSSQTVSNIVENARTDEKWGKGGIRTGQNVMVEYTDPNPFKEFHIGHLMSNAIGESISRLLEFSGAKVLRANYQGDVGLHVAKAIWGYRNLDASQIFENEIARWGASYKYGSSQYEVDENAKNQIDLLGQEIFENSAMIPEYQIGRELSLKHFAALRLV